MQGLYCLWVIGRNDGSSKGTREIICGMPLNYLNQIGQERAEALKINGLRSGSNDLLGKFILTVMFLAVEFVFSTERFTANLYCLSRRIEKILHL